MQVQGSVRHAGRSAICHIRRAWALKDIDKEMAAFRGITAEEESVRTISHALQKRRYPGAGGLRWRDHRQKAAVDPFFRAVSQALEELAKGVGVAPSLDISKSDQTRFRLKWVWLFPGGTHAIRAFPEPPLHWSVQVDGAPLDFSDRLNEVIRANGAKSLDEHREKLANRRNQILYAAHGGVPSWDGPVDGFLRGRSENALLNLVIFLLIDPYPEHQHFVLQALASFIRFLRLAKVLDGVERHDLDAHRIRAYLNWESQGRPIGDDWTDWFGAED